MSGFTQLLVEYNDWVMDNFYTYAYLREDGTPYYVGKGKGLRAYGKRSKGVKPPKDKERILILKKRLSEQEAFRHEIYMIAVFGRKDLGTGILRNRTDGGEGPSGVIQSEEHRQKNREANSGERNPRFGVRLGEDLKLKISESMSGEKNPGFGKFWWHNLETGDTLKQVVCPGPGWERGRPKPGEETRQKMRKAHLGKKSSEEVKQKKRKQKWWVNETGETRREAESPGDCWQRGRKWTG